MKKFIILLTTIMLLSTNFVFADWVTDGAFYKYENNGVFITNDWLTIEGDNYYFDELSHMVKGLKKIGNNYYVFHNTGKAYTRKEHFTFNDVEYDIGAKGKVKDLELDITEEEYTKYINEKAIEDANNMAFAAQQKAYAESEKARLAAEAKAKEAAVAAQRAQMVAEAKAKEESQKAFNEFLISSENRDKLQKAFKNGNGSKPIVDSIITEMRAQLNYRQLELINDAKAKRAIDPTLQLYTYVNDYTSIVKEYAKTADGMLLSLQQIYKFNDEKYEGYVERFSELFEQCQTAFNTQLDNQLG